MTRTGDRIDSMQAEIKAWSNVTKEKILTRLAAMGLKDRAALSKKASKIRLSRTKSGKAVVQQEEYLYNSIRASLKQRNGDLQGVAFSFARHGIFLERGVGKNRPKGSPAANAADRKWITPVLPAQIEALADILQQEYADIAAGEIVINVPGIMKTKVSVG